ncbi:MAG TPA: carboxypeptidase-like regulatory domain-containing protein [Polyangia bacterium]|nr:carboxypeptidase-like regulatory domain-containing protein [Polyangia bacterium]
MRLRVLVPVVVLGLSSFSPAAPVVAAVPAPPGEPISGATPRPARAPSPVLTIVGRVAVNGSVPLPGVVVSLSGSDRRTTVTDAGGGFRFRVPPGSYVVGPARAPGAAFAPEAVRLDNLAADAIQDFSCSGNCAAGPAVVSGKELVITDPSVVNDARASNATGGAPWSFRFLMEQMAPPGTEPSDFVAAWLGQFEIPDGSVNGFPVDVRRTATLRQLWPMGDGGKPDLARAPFRLLAIINRVDLHASGNGEARLVFGAVDATGAGRPMTVAFEFLLPTTDPRTGAPVTRADWAARFHALNGLPFGPGYNFALQAITDLFTRRGTSPAGVGGSSLGQVRTNEILMGGPWQLREFHLAGSPDGLGLRLAPTPQTPVGSAITDGTPEAQALLRYLSGSPAAIHGGFAAVPQEILGGQSNENFSWTFGAPVDKATRRAFAGQTCNGCHFSEITGLQLDGFYHLSPTADPGADGSGRLSNFIKLIEIPRRTFFMQNLLTCRGATCAPGAEPALL